MSMKTYPCVIPKEKQIPIGAIVQSPKPNGEQRNMITGGWRILRPVCDHNTCTMCMTCFYGCPDACITVKGDKINHNLEFCKGCGICTEVCPVDAVARVPELDFADGVTRLETPF